MKFLENKMPYTSFKKWNSYGFIAATLMLPVLSQPAAAQSNDPLSNRIEKIRAKHPELIAQFGGFIASEGRAQVINAASLRGNGYTVNNTTKGNALFGVGYYLDGMVRECVDVKFGLDWLYMRSTSVAGFINQEQLFQNLSYRYNVRNMPLYLAAKAKYKESKDRFDWIFDIGAGPNFIRTSGYNESSLTDFTIPNNNTFTAHNNVAFTAMAGVGIRTHNVFGKIPLECGYRFMYLGSGQLQNNNNQVSNTLSTGHGYANSVVCGVVL
jgi:hypothetical protein